MNTSPDLSHPKQRYRPVSSRTLNDGVRSAWNGHSPTQFRPVRLSWTCWPTTSTIETALRIFSMSSSAIAMGRI